jgi:hypothetical protein
MKRFALLAVAALVALGLMPATAGAGVDAGTAQVTIVHDATYNAPSAPFTVTVCAGGQVIDGSFSWGDTIGPLTLPATTIPVGIYVGADQPCEGEPDIGGDLVLEAGDDITVAAIWTSQTEGPGLAIWPNDSSCYEAATPARLTVRHGAFTATEGNPSGDVDVIGFVAGVETTVVADLGEGEQATLDLPAPLTVTDAGVFGSDDGALFIDLGDQTFEAGNHYVVYAGGGADGDADVFVDIIEMDPCTTPVVPTTPTTAAPTTAPPAAQPAAVTPRFTG